jgi:hypothetical protein
MRVLARALDLSADTSSLTETFTKASILMIFGTARGSSRLQMASSMTARGSAASALEWWARTSSPAAAARRVIVLQGRETFPSGDVYQGEWLNDLKDGQGVLKYADGHIYDGTWKMVPAAAPSPAWRCVYFLRSVTWRCVQGYMHGQGIEKFADKSEFSG